MEEYKFLLDIAIILAMTKSFSLVSKKFNMPPVVGALIAGIILGPVVLNVVSPSDSVLNLAEVGVVVLMFQAGLETDIDELKKSGIPAFVIALCGVLIPLIMGAVLSVIYGNNIMESIFIGVILTATSVSITVEALQDMGHLKGRVGTAILGAAIIDDILGIVLLSIMTSLGGASGFHIQAILKILIQMAAFFAISIIGGVGIKKFFEWLSTYKNPEIERHRRRVPVFALAFCLALAFLAEVFGIADITGAYLAGIILCRLPERFYIYNKIEVLSYMLITPVFFASIGLKVSLPEMNSTIVAFAVVLTIVAILTKVVGCGLGAKLCHYKNYQALRIGVGMISRGEVALIVASKGESLGLMSTAVMGPVVIVVILTTIIAPILLKPVFKRGPETTMDPNVAIAKHYEAISKFREGK